jgi:hypothetical protein
MTSRTLAGRSSWPTRNTDTVLDAEDLRTCSGIRTAKFFVLTAECRWPAVSATGEDSRFLRQFGEGDERYG